MKHALKSAALAALLGLAGCDNLGDGNTIEKIEIRPASRATQLQGYEPGGIYKVPQCLRDELILVATFTDGSSVNFSGRATWSSSDPAVVQVSNRDIPFVFATNSPADDGNFYEHETLEYAAGTLVPLGTPGQSAVITAKFASLKASINVEIREPSLRIVPVPNDDPVAAVDPVVLGQGSTQRLTVLVDVGGRTVPLADLFGSGANSLNINPLRWVLTGAAFEPQDDDVSGDSDRWVIDDGANPVVTLHTTSLGDGVVTGFQSGASEYEVIAETSLCDDPSTVATLRPQVGVKVGTFATDPDTADTTDYLVLTPEPGFNGGGFATGDFVMGTSHQLDARAFVDDGTTITEQIFTQQARYLVLPFNAGCRDAGKLLGCTGNADFSATATGAVRTTGGAAEGDDARVHACFPLCLLPTATLGIDDADGVVDSGVTVNFTAAAINPPPKLTLNYVFDFGDGTTAGPQASPLASHAYAADGMYTATVRIVDEAFPAEFLSQNQGAVRILSGVGATPGNNAPVAALSLTGFTGNAPLSVVMSASGSADADAGDAITVYEFDPGDGTSPIRQAEATLTYTYFDGTGGPFTPTVTVYDESGAASAAASDATDGVITVNGVAPDVMWSDAVAFRARDATLCSVELLPDAAADPTEAAFTFPPMRFQAVGSFVADTATDACTDPVIGEQLVTRFVFWRLRTQGDPDTVPAIAEIANFSDDFRVPGQVRHFENVAADILFDVSAVPVTPFTNDITPTPTTLTLTPCAGCVP